MTLCGCIQREIKISFWKKNECCKPLTEKALTKPGGDFLTAPAIYFICVNTTEGISLLLHLAKYYSTFIFPKLLICDALILMHLERITWMSSLQSSFQTTNVVFFMIFASLCVCLCLCVSKNSVLCLEITYSRLGTNCRNLFFFYHS